jgi:hypothetical protein
LPDDGDQVIYIFSLHVKDGSSEKLKSIVADSEAAIALNTEGYTQITGVNNLNFQFRLANMSEKIALYVGTSGNFADRLKQHVGKGSKGTATIFLKKWPFFSEEKHLVNVQYFNFKNTFPTEALKLIENRLSADLRPIIGRNRKA